MSNSTTQFYVDPAASRKMHLGSLRAVSDLVSSQRGLTVSDSARYLVEIDILLKIGKAGVEYQVLYNQPSNCKQVATSP
jgi:hypothetical protein